MFQECLLFLYLKVQYQYWHSSITKMIKLGNDNCCSICSKVFPFLGCFLLKPFCSQTCTMHVVVCSHFCFLCGASKLGFLSAINLTFMEFYKAVQALQSSICISPGLHSVCVCRSYRDTHRERGQGQRPQFRRKGAN